VLKSHRTWILLQESGKIGALFRVEADSGVGGDPMMETGLP
jgi:hypothetical protein